MLLLCSNGITSPALAEALALRISGMKRAALAVTADNEYKEKNYHVPRCTEALTALGLSVDILDLDRDGAEKLDEFDVVEFIGGNPFYLLNAIRKSGAEGALERLKKERVLIGWSAAAFVFGPTLELVNLYSPEMNTVGLTKLDALALTGVEVLPHYDKFIERYSGFEEICAEYERRRGVNVIRLNDGDGVIIEGCE